MIFWYSVIVHDSFCVSRRDRPAGQVGSTHASIARRQPPPAENQTSRSWVPCLWLVNLSPAAGRPGGGSHSKFFFKVSNHVPRLALTIALPAVRRDFEDPKGSATPRSM